MNIFKVGQIVQYVSRDNGRFYNCIAKVVEPHHYDDAMEVLWLSGPRKGQQVAHYERNFKLYNDSPFYLQVRDYINKELGS